MLWKDWGYGARKNPKEKKQKKKKKRSGRKTAPEKEVDKVSGEGRGSFCCWGMKTSKIYDLTETGGARILDFCFAGS